jgi:hypothetical protein
MARGIHKLGNNERSIKKLLNQPGTHNDGGGLFLRVTKAGNASWIYQFCLRGKARQMSLGRFRTMTIGQARKEHFKLMSQVDRQIDPLPPAGTAAHPARRNLITAPLQRSTTPSRWRTFEQEANHYLDVQRAGGDIGEGQYKEHISRLQRFVFPAIGNLPADTIRSRDIVELLRPIWNGKRDDKGSKIRSLIERILETVKLEDDTTLPRPVAAHWDLLQRDLNNRDSAPRVDALCRRSSLLRPSWSRKVHRGPARSNS